MRLAALKVVAACWQVWLHPVELLARVLAIKHGGFSAGVLWRVQGKTKPVVTCNGLLVNIYWVLGKGWVLADL